MAPPQQGEAPFRNGGRGRRAVAGRVRARRRSSPPGKFLRPARRRVTRFDTDRIGRGSIHIPNLCVTLFGGIQPDKLRAYLEEAEHALSNDGALQRFQLLVYPDPRQWEYRDQPPMSGAADKIFEIVKQLSAFDPLQWGAEPSTASTKIPAFRFDDAAQSIFVEWLTELHRIRLPATEQLLVTQHLTKYEKLFPALALILHLVECSATGLRGPVSEAAAVMAAGWCEYLEGHARRCYGLLADGGAQAAKALADGEDCLFACGQAGRGASTPRPAAHPGSCRNW